MRSLEIVLLAANLVAFVVLVVPLRGRVRWMRHLALLPLPAAGVQVLVEGWRWQMVPAYALAVLFFLAWLLKTIKPAGRPARRRWARPLTTGLGTGLGVLGLVVSTALPMVFPVFGFPHPTGPYAIGTLTYHWVDGARPEVFTTNPADHRELMVQIWYPAKPDPSAPRAPYIPDAGVIAPALARRLHLPGLALGHLKYITSNAVTAAPVAAGQRTYPVLIFLAGRGGYRQANTFQIEELVSHGYIVAAIDQPYAFAMVVFPDGRRVPYDPRMDHRSFEFSSIPYLARDVTTTLDQLTALNQVDPHGILTGRLDLRHVGLFGHSMGGEVGADACQADPRLRACLLEDVWMPAGVVRDGLQQPAMWITRDAGTMRLERRRAGGWSGADIHLTLSTMRAVFESLPTDGYYVQVPGMFHIEMSDAPLLSPLLAPMLGLSGPLGVQRAHRIINAYTLAFFDRHLKGLPAPLLDGPSRQYPEVRLEIHRP
jgi:predicted dienelactone hydrolase